MCVKLFPNAPGRLQECVGPLSHVSMLALI